MEHRAVERPTAYIDQTMYCPRRERAVDIEQCFACSSARAAKRGESVLPLVCTWRGDLYRRLPRGGFVV